MPPIGATFKETASGSSCVLRELALQIIQYASIDQCFPLPSVIGILLPVYYHMYQQIVRTSFNDLRRPTKFRRYKPVDPSAPPDDPVADYMNILGMIFSMCGLMMRLKWCAWVALYCSFVSFSNSKITDDAKQIVSSFMLSISSVVMCYLQNPTPINYAL
ncbi:Protein Asterix [Trichinella spiralis]|uniref:Protein Asterix n=2 Tax=Trichinella TaxID=6333 RepID=A0A0V1BMU8_TRISP|nr:Protein Asterix [Trichinella spiralis]